MRVALGKSPEPLFETRSILPMHNHRFHRKCRPANAQTLRFDPLRRRFIRRSVSSVVWAASGGILRADDRREPPTRQPAQVSESQPTTGQDVPELESFDRFMRDFIINERLPGGALAISRGDRLVYARGFGFADRELGIPLSRLRCTRTCKRLEAVHRDRHSPTG